MKGLANIPDDWTGDYIDYVVRWPDSDQWEAILRGQLTDPAFDDFWDLNSGDPNSSMVAMHATFDTNLHLQEGAMIPTGTIIDFAGSTIPSGWLVCDFHEENRVTKARLYSIIGTTYGDGDGVNTFNVPPASGKVNVALDITDADFNALGEFRGSKNVTLEVSEIPAHTHLQDAHNHSQNPHLHVVPSGTSVGGSTPGYVLRDPLSNLSTAFPSTNNTTATNNPTTATNQNTGGGNAHNNIQPSIVFYRLIKD